MFNVRLAGGHQYGKQLFTWLWLVVSLKAKYNKGEPRGQRTWIFGIIHRDTNSLIMYPFDRVILVAYAFQRKGEKQRVADR